ncbi:hypothetical protein [Ornithinibacillus xuwenensis]|uniref:Uncharacterized protein n=1 Tax=Ornithinibacillus xuwenensis TaxID=3144668 RepID=A0ABU9XC07_9BACI
MAVSSYQLMNTSGGKKKDKNSKSTKSPQMKTAPGSMPTQAVGGLIGITEGFKKASSKPKTSTPKTSTPSSGGSSGGGGGAVGAAAGGTPTMEQNQKNHEKEYRNKFEKQIQNELDRYEKQLRDELQRNEKGINDEISRLEASGRATIDRNNEYLSNQIAQLQDQKVVADQDTINWMNRRGMTYSGGTDYFLAQNQRATQQATGNLQSEIGSRNAEIEQSNQLARERALSQISMSREQAMSTLNMMREQAPDKVRQLVDDALERQWAKDFQMEQFNFQKQQAAAASARAAASQALAQRRFQAQQQQQAWENAMAEKQFAASASKGRAGSNVSGLQSNGGLGQRDLEVFQSQFGGDLGSASAQDIRSFVNTQYANGMLYDESEADQLENYLNSLRTPGGSNNNNKSTPKTWDDISMDGFSNYLPYGAGL